ncbi:serine protease [Pseudonocardia sulfidoxydans NBRC 16205]|uniref:Serine protease n=1 Tax=Pseudonocardia sulfidoxydans NBRC 16205 TaxID=1223511 RepID=A0A511DGV1_9PSEU|nr:S1 family peptidase [Pseudonocardia sulfidoxydans]GEL24016.1 serine protease [Pseudonocardia sulfidoxydans NBRC 16205]
MSVRLRRVICGVAIVAAAVTTLLAATLSAPASAAPVTALLDPAAVKALIDGRAALGLPAEVADYGVDEQSGRLVVELTGSRTPAVDALLSGVDPNVLDVRTDAPAPRHHAAAVKGGDTIISGSRRCTLGFAATARGRTWLLTAGHCTRGSGTWSVETAGDVLTPIGSQARTASAGTDVGVVPVTGSGVQVRGLVGSVAVRGSTPAAVGSPVCLYGSTSGRVCGTVTGLDRTVNFEGTIQYGMTATSICSAEGDSGGPYITSSGQAQGIHSGGGTGRGCTSYLTPIGPALSAFGLRLLTS